MVCHRLFISEDDGDGSGELSLWGRAAVWVLEGTGGRWGICQSCMVGLSFSCSPSPGMRTLVVVCCFETDSLFNLGSSWSQDPPACWITAVPHHAWHIFFFFFGGLFWEKFEPKASHCLGRCFTTWATLPALFCIEVFFELGSCELLCPGWL
jgi:hypothetical protein